MKSFKAMLAIAVLAVGAVSLQAQDKDIVETAVTAGNFQTLVKALQAAGLVDTLKGAGPFTVFAPTDDAFAKLPSGALDALIANPAKLKEVLLYHVVAGKVMAADVKSGVDKTAEGASLKITVKDGKVFVNRAQVIKTDVVCSNGVIHVIDAVLMPKLPESKMSDHKM